MRYPNHIGEGDRMIDTKLKTLLALLEYGSYTKAAKHLHLTQPAVSYQIRQLEKEYQIQIFHDHKKDLLLTIEGQILVKFAKRMDMLSENCMVALQDAKLNIRHFTIAATPSAGEDLVPEMIGQYCTLHPKTHIRFFMNSLDDIEQKLKLFEADIAFVDGRLSSNKYNSILLDTDTLCLMVSPKHWLAQRSSVTLEELRKENFILRTRKAGTRALFEQYLQSTHDTIHHYNVIIETDSLATIRELVEKNLGVSIMSRSLCVKDEALGRCKTLTIENAAMIREVYMVYHNDFDHPEILRELQELYHHLQDE